MVGLQPHWLNHPRISAVTNVVYISFSLLFIRSLASTLRDYSLCGGSRHVKNGCRHDGDQDCNDAVYKGSKKREWFGVGEKPHVNYVLQIGKDFVSGNGEGNPGRGNMSEGMEATMWQVWLGEDPSSAVVWSGVFKSMLLEDCKMNCGNIEEWINSLLLTERNFCSTWNSSTTFAERHSSHLFPSLLSLLS